MFKKSLLIPLFVLCVSFINHQNQVTLYIIGDSTAANKDPKLFPETGWGMAFQDLFKPAVKVDNRAANGRSTKSFINEKRWDAILSTLKEGDFVFIEFGHNDEKTDQPAVGTSLPEFKLNLVKFVQETKAKKANPVLLTPIVRRWFRNEVFVDSHKGYPDVVRHLADSLHIPLIDMQQKTEKLITQMGAEPSKSLFNHVEPGHANFPQGKKDDTHLNQEGAKAVAKLVTEGIKENKLSLTQYLN